MMNLSRQTCSEACWQAKEEVCRCSCNGKNHGCMMVDGRPQPGRTRRTGDTRYRLVAVLNHTDSCFTYRGLQHKPSYAFQVVPKKSTWPEAQGAADYSSFLWVLDGITPETVERDMATCKAEEEAENKRFHLARCDGVTPWPKWKNPPPCDHPEWHGALSK